MTPTTPSPISDQAASELLPCPFCGAPVSFMPYKRDGLKIECKPCVISYAQRTMRFDLDWLAKKMAAHWNRRSTAPTTGSAPVANSDEWQKGYVAGRFDLESKIAAGPAASVPHPSIARAIAQEERACRAEDALIDLVNQIRKSNPVDDHGHDLKMNRAYLESVKLLDAVALLAASTGGDRK